MTERDIVDRLRMIVEPTYGDMEDAADEIERLRAVAIERASDEAKAHVYSVKMRQENDRLREALQGLLDEQNGPPLIGHAASWQAAVDAARAALEGRTDG